MKIASKSLRVSAVLTLLLCGFVSAEDDQLEPSSLGLSSGAIRVQITAKQHAALSAEMTGRIKSLPLREGQVVEKGQLLAAFDCDVPQAQLKKAKIQVEASKNTLAGNQRMAELNAIGHLELENSRLEYLKSKADVEFLDAQMKRCELVAPYDGAITELHVNEQEFIQLGTPMLEILDQSNLQVEFIAPSWWVSWLKSGYPFEIKVDDTGEIYQTKVDYVAAKVDAVSQSIKVVAQIEGKGIKLKPGMSGQILLDQQAQY